MLKPSRHRPLRPTWLLLALTILLSSLLLPGPVPGKASESAQMQSVFLPSVSYDSGYPQPFGVEWVSRPSLTTTYTAHAQELGIRWVRLHRISWRAIQPTEGAAYDWSVLSNFESEIIAAQQAGLTPMVIVHHSPEWATVNEPFVTDCGAIRADKFGAFADFMSALVSRYKQSPYNVHYWELGNEPDVDPRLVPANSVFGCWGDIGDPYYGGRHYGEMLKVVTPAIKAADPQAKVIIGGLLLARPVPNPGEGDGHRFFEGMLVAGAAPHMDIVAYHAYPSYGGINVDYDLAPVDWESRGGYTRGKARFLREVMAAYGVSKPVIANETALGCNPDVLDCDPPPVDFLQAQADYLARTFTRARSEDISGLIWYTLSGPGWRDTGLLDDSGLPRPSYWSYQQFVKQLNRSIYQGVVAYGGDVEAYSFTRAKDRLHVAWSVDASPNVINVPQANFLAAYDRDGTPLTPVAAGSDYQLTVGFSPIYIVLKQ